MPVWVLFFKIVFFALKNKENKENRGNEPVWFLILKNIIENNFENTDNTKKKLLFENSSLFFKFSVFCVFFLCFLETN